MIPLGVLLLAGPALAQDAPLPWSALVDGERLWEADSVMASADAAAQAALAALQARGFLAAVIDSAVVQGGRGTLHLRRGALTTVDRVHIEGLTVLDADLLLASLETRSGSALDVGALGRDLGRILAALERAGRPAAMVEVAQVEVHPKGASVTIAVAEGRPHVLRGLELVPSGRTSAAFAARLAGLRPGLPLEDFDATRIQSELEASGLFAAVGTPELAIEDEGYVLVRVEVEEAQPGAVDLVLGYLPPAVPGGPAALVGSGSLVLRNLFGRGRRLGVELQRHPGLVSALDLRLADPFLFDLPLRLEARFSGYQSDSTFARHTFALEAGYRLARGLELVVAASRETVEAGVAGGALLDGRPRVPPADAWFAGAGLRFAQLDRPRNPRRGLTLEALLERGLQHRTLPQGADEPARLQQQRLRAATRLFIPTLRRQTAVIGGDVGVLLGDSYNESDLFRFGGAATLRGYDEERFRGNVVGRGVIEYRYLLDPTSHAFVFFDLGFVGRPATPGAPPSQHVLPGYGIGLQYHTPLGIATATYALNPDEGPTRGRVHVGLSIGL